ncbi:MAG: hypothetical protein JNG85_11235 [Spirochaetaceae bacterium]|nr:hypothetical protein [Spirochaetaceae bacterium]
MKPTCYNLRKAGYRVKILADRVTSHDKRKIGEMLACCQSQVCDLLGVRDL